MGNIVSNKKDKQLVMKIAKLIEEHKGEDITVLYVGTISSWTDFFVIATVRSTTHSKGLFRELKSFLKAQDVTIINNSRAISGGGWILLDCGNFIIHLMEKDERNFYELEKLWFNGTTLFQSSKSS